MTKDKPTVFIVDSSGFIFRAYHAIRGGLTAADGTPTNAVYGFTMMMLKLIREHNPEYLIPVFDVSRRTFRSEIYPEYKANRPPAPDDLVEQFPLVREVVNVFQLPPVEMEGFEADDVIGTLAGRLSKAGHEVRIITSDKDLMQLVNDKVWLIDTWKNIDVKEPEVFKKFGVTPDKVIDVLALAGDKSDNVPGVVGIGEKTASALVNEFGSMEEVLQNIDKVKGAKRKQNLTENTELAKLSKKLVTIDCNVPIEVELENFKVRGFDEEKARELFLRLDFKKLLESLSDGGETQTESKIEINRDAYVLVDNKNKLQSMIDELSTAALIAFDTETTSTNSLLDDLLVGMSFSISEATAYYVPVAHSLLGTVQISKPDALQMLGKLFANPDAHWVMQNAKFDLQVMKTEGVEFAGLVEDTMLLSYTKNPAQRRHGLDAMSQDLLGHKMISYSEICGTGKKQITFDQVDTVTACKYSGEDADITLRLFYILREDVANAKLAKLYQNLERPLIPVLMEMERNGFKVDIESLKKLSAAFEKMLLSMESEIFELSGEKFNINSPKQLQEILFEKLNLPKGKKTKSGYSTDSKVLMKLSATHPLPELVLNYRQMAKLRSTYSEALLRLVSKQDGRIHTSFNQTVTLTGRLSSSDPNLQNIPIRTEAGRMIRQAFIAEDGFILMAADYSQVELRILAHLSKDPILNASFEKDEDIHSRTASEVFDTLPGLVDKEMRRRAKAVNFGIIYGQTAYGLSESLSISFAEARKIIENYFSRYSKVQEYIEDQKEKARSNGFVKTMFDRVIPLNDINARNANMRSYAERVAINAPIQGSAADIIKVAMIDLHETLKSQKLKSKMLLQVHDELIFEVHQSEKEIMEKLVREKMEGAIKLAVPLKVDIGFGDNWDEAH